MTRIGTITIWNGSDVGYAQYPYVARELGENPIGYGDTPAEALGNLLLTDPRGPEGFGGLKINIDSRAEKKQDVQEPTMEHCEHGHCLKHQPDWENVGERKYLPNPGFFGKKTYWTSRCCGKAMKRYKIIQVVRCKLCGVTATDIISQDQAFCECCGRNFFNISYDI